MLEATEVKEYPKPLYQTEKAALMENAQNAATEYGMSWEDYLAAVGMDENTYNEQLKEETRETLKQNMAVYDIADRENIEVTEDDAVEHIKEELEEHGMTEEEFEKNQGMSIEEYAKENDMGDHILLEKVQDFIFDNAKLTTVEAAEDGAGHEYTHEHEHSH